ncbi:MAG TPA: papain-like cysteine protease family protein [Bryobacteraceae bacterium]|nr:papain-like cysteine protease family protein [Bryobacteraceae bacterium]
MPIKMTPQQEPNWCWAAVASAVRTFFSPAAPTTQCSIANPVLVGEGQIGEVVNCCANAGQCDKPALLEDALNAVNSLKQKATGFLAFAAVEAELNAGRPIGVRIQWSDGGGHFILIDGFRVFSSGAQQVHVADPFYGPCYMLHSALVNNYLNDGVWTHTYFVHS